MTDYINGRPFVAIGPHIIRIDSIAGIYQADDGSIVVVDHDGDELPIDYETMEESDRVFKVLVQLLCAHL